MPQEQLGYIELEWVCPNCGTRNAGTRKTCVTCGAARGKDTEFNLPAQQELLKDDAKLQQAKLGPDIACPYCGTANAANATSCKQCGGDLTAGTARFKGGVLGAFDDAPAPEVKCQNCGSMNPATATKCANCGASLARPPTPKTTPPPQTIAPKQQFNPLILGGLAVLALLLCGGAYFLFGRTSDITGTVASTNWERSIAVLAQVPVRDATWQDSLPVDAEVLSCELRPRRTSNFEEPNSTKVCGTPYVVDQGNGIGQVVQDCQFQVSEQYCSFTRLEWTIVDTVTTRGTDLNPTFPALNLQQDQREGNRAEQYRVIFDSGGQQYTYTPNSVAEYMRFRPGTRWRMTVNALGGISSLEPVQ